MLSEGARPLRGSPCPRAPALCRVPPVRLCRVPPVRGRPPSAGFPLSEGAHVSAQWASTLPSRARENSPGRDPVPLSVPGHGPAQGGSEPWHCPALGKPSQSVPLPTRALLSPCPAGACEPGSCVPSDHGTQATKGGRPGAF